MRIEIFVEELSMEVMLEHLAEKLRLTKDEDFVIRNFGDKQALLGGLPRRLADYANFARAENMRIVVVVDRDNDDCMELKNTLETAALDAGFITKSVSGDGNFSVVNRIVIEELEAWFLGDPQALRAAFPRLPEFADKAPYRDPDAITGGTWESLLRLLNESGYYAGMNRLPKLEVAGKVAPHMNINANASRSFQVFIEGLRACVQLP